MNDIVESYRFYDDGNDKREIENFQNFLFKDVRLENEERPVSFYRSDFRGCKITNSSFCKNNFDRADFIDAYIEDSSFSGCFFGTDFINTYFQNVTFNDNTLDVCTFTECFFANCQFINEKISNSGYNNCQYSSCILADCIYEQNTLDDLSFTGTFFENIVLSDSNSQNIGFINCKFNNLVLDPDYIGSYLFKDTSIREITFKSRGKDFDLNDEVIEIIQVLKKFYFTQKRYPELLNTTIIHNDISKSDDDIQKVFFVAIKKILEDEHFLRRKNNIKNIFKLLQFYSDSNMISVKDLSVILYILENTNIDKLGMVESLDFQNQVNKTKALFEANLLNTTSGRVLPAFDPIYMEIKIDEEDLDEVSAILKDIFKILRDEYYHSMAVEDVIKISGIRKGSIYFDIIGYTGAVIALCAALKSMIKVYVYYKFSKKVMRLVAKKEKATEIKAAAEIMPIVMRGTTEELSSNARRLSRRARSVKVYPNSSMDTWY